MSHRYPGYHDCRNCNAGWMGPSDLNEDNEGSGPDIAPCSEYHECASCLLEVESLAMQRGDDRDCSGGFNDE